MRYYYINIRMAKVKKSGSINAGKNVKPQRLSFMVDGNKNDTETL